jgi:hypothetical protein
MYIHPTVVFSWCWWRGISCCWYMLELLCWAVLLVSPQFSLNIHVCWNTQPLLFLPQVKWSETFFPFLPYNRFSESELVFIITTSLGYGFSSVSFLLHDMQILSLLSNKIFLHALRNGWDKTIFGLVSVECSAEMQISFFCVSCKGHSRNGPGSYHLFSFSESI